MRCSRATGIALVLMGAASGLAASLAEGQAAGEGTTGTLYPAKATRLFLAADTVVATEQKLAEICKVKADQTCFDIAVDYSYAQIPNVLAYYWL